MKSRKRLKSSTEVKKNLEEFALPDSHRKRAKNVRAVSGRKDDVKDSMNSETDIGIQENKTLKNPGEFKTLDKHFYNCDALELAPKLLGKLLRREEVVLQITEVEAYRHQDTACHGRFGITPRTAPLFGPGGHAYVYLCYGLHIMLNVVADKAGVGAAVLIRACSPVSGLKTIQDRRKQYTDKPSLLTGPGKVGQALGLNTEWSGHPLYAPGDLEILDGPAPPGGIVVGPRVGINYAAAHDVAALWRFAIAGSLWISAPRDTLNPLNSLFVRKAVESLKFNRNNREENRTQNT